MHNIYLVIGRLWILYFTKKELRPKENKWHNKGYSDEKKILKTKVRISAQCFSPLLFYVFSFRNGAWTIDASCYPSFQVTCLLRFPFSEMWILTEFCLGSTNCHSNVTYWSCRQPASHKSCKIPENMIYELSYGKWDPLIFLTLQDVVTYHRISFSLTQRLSRRSVLMFTSPAAPTSTPTNTDFYTVISIPKEFAASLSHHWVWILDSKAYSAVAITVYVPNALLRMVIKELPLIASYCRIKRAGKQSTKDPRKPKMKLI